jgi:hypothetical protein
VDNFEKICFQQIFFSRENFGALPRYKAEAREEAEQSEAD